MLYLYKFCHRSIIDRRDTAVAINHLFGWCCVFTATRSPRSEIRDEAALLLNKFDKVNEHQRILPPLRLFWNTSATRDDKQETSDLKNVLVLLRFSTGEMDLYVFYQFSIQRDVSMAKNLLKHHQQPSLMNQHRCQRTTGWLCVCGSSWQANLV